MATVSELKSRLIDLYNDLEDDDQKDLICETIDMLSEMYSDIMSLTDDVHDANKNMDYHIYKF